MSNLEKTTSAQVEALLRQHGQRPDDFQTTIGNALNDACTGETGWNTVKKTIMNSLGDVPR
jgi:hypothetical protein